MKYLVIALLLVSAVARADDDDVPELQKMKFVERGADLYVTTSIGKLFDFEAFKALKTGFASTVAIQYEGRRGMRCSSPVTSATRDSPTRAVTLS